MPQKENKMLEKFGANLLEKIDEKIESIKTWVGIAYQSESDNKIRVQI